MKTIFAFLFGAVFALSLSQFANYEPPKVKALQRLDLQVYAPDEPCEGRDCVSL